MARNSTVASYSESHSYGTTSQFLLTSHLDTMHLHAFPEEIFQTTILRAGLYVGGLSYRTCNNASTFFHDVLQGLYSTTTCYPPDVKR